MKKLLISIIRLFIILLFLAGCAVNKNISSLPENNNNPIRVYSAIFSNKTYKPLINEAVSEEFIKLLISAGQFKFTARAEADYIINGTITSYTKSVESYDYKDKPQMHRLSISAEIRILNNSADAIEPIIINSDASTLYSEVTTSPETERQAIDRLKKILAVKLHSKLSEKFNGS